MGAGSTSPWTGEGRTMQEQLSRATQDAKAEAGIQVFNLSDENTGRSNRNPYVILDSGIRQNDGWIMRTTWILTIRPLF